MRLRRLRIMEHNGIGISEEVVLGCMKCGFCKAACPLFLGEETHSPRAKVRLARAAMQGEIGMTDRVRTLMHRCLNCRACVSECPSGIEPNRVALLMRGAFVERNGLPLAERIIFRGALPNARRMELGSRLMGLAQRVSGVRGQRSPLRRLLPLVGMPRDKDLPAFARRSLASLVPEISEPIGTHRTTAVYFPGCACNLLFPEIGLATVSVLRKLGARVILPRGLVCCSTPVFNSGDMTRARSLASSNISLLASIDADFIITSCGSCGLTIKKEWTELLGLAEAQPIAAKVLDISEFAARYVDPGALKPLEGGSTVTYHDACHLLRGMGVRDEPRRLLHAILGARFVEMRQADRCCGGGGTFSIHHPDLSQTVAETKMDCIAQSGADTIAAGRRRA